MWSSVFCVYVNRKVLFEPSPLTAFQTTNTNPSFFLSEAGSVVILLGKHLSEQIHHWCWRLLFLSFCLYIRTFVMLLWWLSGRSHSSLKVILFSLKRVYFCCECGSFWSLPLVFRRGTACMHSLNVSAPLGRYCNVLKYFASSGNKLKIQRVSSI